MKYKIITLLGFLIFNIVKAQTPCNNGQVNGFPCNNIDFYARLSNQALGGNINTDANDIWGWTDPLTEKEYAIIGLESHTAFVDVSTPSNPIYLGKLQSATTSSVWRDIKVYNDHAFIVSEAPNHGMQVFDLTKLRDVTVAQEFQHDAHYTAFGNCHNIAINEETGFAYAIGSNTFDGGPHIVNIQSPLNPQFAGGYAVESYTHDAQIIIYNGPDIEHVGKELFFGANEDKVVVLDVTDKQNITTISTFTYQNTEYTHQGWLTDDHRYFLVGDEFDETAIGFNTKTIVIDYQDLDNPSLKINYFGTTAAIDHNGYVLGNDFYLANYRAGLRLIDITNLSIGQMQEIGFFDTFPNNNASSFNGAWSVYPYFESGTIIVSDIERGLFVLKKGSALLSNVVNNRADYEVFPNPAKNQLEILSHEPIENIQIYNAIGQQIKSEKMNPNLNVLIDVTNLTNGIYYLIINEKITKKISIQK